MGKDFNRIVWVDWAKSIGIMIVVFCHVPTYDTLIKQFFCSFQMPLFFFLSGYLHKIPLSFHESIKKYWKTLIIPYMLFQLIGYPYWYIRSVYDGENVSGIYNAMIEPFMNCLWGIPINGITWFIFALFFMKIYADIILNSKYKNLLVAISCIITILISYIINSDNVINFNFSIDSGLNFFPFFFLGYYIKNRDKRIHKVTNSGNRLKYVLCSLFCLIICLGIIIFSSPAYWVQRINFYLLGVIGSYFIIYGCKSIRGINKVITTISFGTIILLGLHWMFIGTINFILQKILYIEKGIIYSTGEAFVLVLVITAICYFIM